jgi:DNA-directed RNA polymerase subunit RPC12/RpoP
VALINCSECGKEVSDKATSCPNCGAPIATKDAVTFDPKPHAKVTRTGAKWEGIGFVLILVGIILALAVNGTLGGILAYVGFVVFVIGRFL